MGKIIIHNKTNLTEVAMIQHLKCVLEKLSEKPDTAYFEFADGVRVKFYQQKTCKTFYIYN